MKTLNTALFAAFALAVSFSGQLAQAGGCSSGGGYARSHSYGGYHHAPRYHQTYHAPVYKPSCHKEVHVAPVAPIHAPQHVIAQPAPQPVQPQIHHIPQQQVAPQPVAPQGVAPQGIAPQQQFVQQPQVAPQGIAPQPGIAPQQPVAPQQQLAPQPNPMDALGGFAPPQAATPVAPVAPAPAYVGSWTATLGNGATVQLQMLQDGQFSWAATNAGGAVSTFQGTYTVNDGALTLLRANDNQQLAGAMTISGNDAFSFQLGQNNAAKLNFARQN